MWSSWILELNLGHITLNSGCGCGGQLESLLEEADAGEDFEMDPMLREACAPVAKELCGDLKPGDGRLVIRVIF